jgi:uncharacterized protein (DUF342 family)
MVQEGEVLARVQPIQEGLQGTTVTGKALPYETKKIQKLAPGPNTNQDGDCVVATCSGRFEISQTSFRVNEILELESDVDYGTGHIDFPGDVIIHGEIKDDFRVHSGGSIYCKKTMDASEVSCSGDLMVNWGIIGKKKGSVKAGGSVKTRFIENCYVEAKGAIFVEVGIMNSTVYSLDTIELGMKGVIVGGTIHGQNKVVATQIGSTMGPRTEIYLGIDYTVKQKLEWIREKNTELAFKLQQVKRKVQLAEDGKERLLEIQKKLQEALHKMNKAASELLFQLDKNEEATVEVRSAVFPGAYIEICHVPYVVSRKIEQVLFRLDKAKGKVLVEHLSRRS